MTLQREGYETVEARDGEDALRQARRHAPDLVVLDVMLPKLDGIEVCRQLRADRSLQHVTVLMLTARAEESDVVLGLGVGADDYLCKPARPRELAARVKALLRRARARDQPMDDQILARGAVVIDPVRFEVRVSEQRIDFTPTEFRLLQTMMASPGRVFRRAELLDYAVGVGVFVDERNVDTHIKSMRKKLGERADLIETVRGIGYRFADDGS